MKPCSALFLDSGGGWTPNRKDSFIIFTRPALSLLSRDGIATVNLPDREFSTSRNPISLLEGYLNEGYTAVGYLGYEFSRFTEEGFEPFAEKEGDRVPDLYFLFFRGEDTVSGEIHDLRKYLISDAYQGFSDSPSFGGAVNPAARPKSNMTRAEYMKMVTVAKDYIANGDVYQVNLSQRFTTRVEVAPLLYFLNLYSVQPVPFGCYIDFGGFQLTSGSMELFLRKTARKLVTRPIKGTRKRGSSVEEDAILKAELVSSEKERAENLMIVDLMRNDLGRVCRLGTVKVNELFSLESYSTLHQMVSEIEGLLEEEISIVDVIRSTFPPGSVTGAPKRRALEVIDELEPHLRGPYCGAIGIFLPNGDFTLSVGIRILQAKHARAVFWVGAGIVWDSDPGEEYEETLIKARAVKKSLGMVE
jgi:aminodeoxychorismate synthase component I